MAHSAMAAIDRAPARTAAAANHRMVTSGWRRPVRALGVGDGCQVGEQVRCLGWLERISVAKDGQAGWDRG
jgi:hypothetical protein